MNNMELMVEEALGDISPFPREREFKTDIGPPPHQFASCRNDGRRSSTRKTIIDNNFNTTYTLNGIGDHELPVIGTFIDPSILPGFSYKVRKCCGEELFDGKPRHLMSIGMGYGKRMTFCKSSKLDNDNVFWSDSSAKGYAFSLIVISEKQRFVAYDGYDRPTATVSVSDATLHQMEIKQVVAEGTVTKIVRTHFVASIEYEPLPHGVLNIRSDVDNEILEGFGYIVKEKRSKIACLKRIDNVMIPSVGKCYLLPDNSKS